MNLPRSRPMPRAPEDSPPCRSPPEHPLPAPCCNRRQGNTQKQPQRARVEDDRSRSFSLRNSAGFYLSRQMLASALESPSRVHVTATAGGADAIALLSSARYRIVILALPVVARESLLDDMVRRSDQTPVILIIDPDERPPQRPYPSNVKELLTKPVQIPRLKILIRRAADARAARTGLRTPPASRRVDRRVRRGRELAVSGRDGAGIPCRAGTAGSVGGPGSATIAL
jgi:CheY-like chemotaxis protein